MTPIAAYYVMIATERELLDRQHRYQVAAAPRKSIAARIVAALETLVALGRPTTTQPI